MGRMYTRPMTLPRRSFAAMAAMVLGACAVQAQPPQTAHTGPVYVVTHVDIAPGAGGLGGAIQLMHDLQVASLKEPGALRFEVLQQDSRANHFVILETWQSRAAYDAHNGAQHTKTFREKIQPMMGSPFDVRLHTKLP